jgi:serine/threonine-protein kinase RsbW
MTFATPEPKPEAPRTESRFSRTGIVADASSAMQTRAQFGSWIAQHLPLDESELGDVLLATYEALANAAEHAYQDTSGPGTMNLLAHYDTGAGRFVVTVSDAGTWREPAHEAAPAGPTALRGRGIPLMQALAEDATVRGTTDGTHVRLSWPICR